MYQDGEAWFDRCPKELCAAPVILAHVDGLKLRLSTKAIPLRDAAVLEKYGTIIINVWIGTMRLWAVSWFRSQGRVSQGHLYMQHVCRVDRS